MKLFARLLCLCLLLGSAARVGAEDESGPGPMPPGVQELVAAFKERPKAEFEALANDLQDNPWMLVDMLLLHDESDVALAYALALKRPDTARLPEYIEGRRSRGYSLKVRQLAREAEGMTDAARAEPLLARVDAVAGQGDGFERALMETHRGTLLTALGRHGEAAEAHLAAANGAEEIGWLSLAGTT